LKVVHIVLYIDVIAVVLGEGQFWAERSPCNQRPFRCMSHLVILKQACLRPAQQHLPHLH